MFPKTIPNLKENLFIYPTDTVWGIGASIESEALHQRIARVKRTSDDKPVSVLYTSFAELLFDFDLPINLERTEHWWRSFFSMETTLALELRYAKRQIPKWITHQSPLVAIRLNESTDLAALHGVGPISTTSLNLHGQAPIQDQQQALDFFEAYAPDACFIKSQKLALSGRSSTIVHYQENAEIRFLREGGLVEDVKRHLGLSTT